MNQTTKDNSEPKKVCMMCGNTSQGHTIDFESHCGLGETWTYDVCSPECDDRLSDFRMTQSEIIDARERQMERNHAHYVKEFFQQKRRLAAEGR